MGFFENLKNVITTENRHVADQVLLSLPQATLSNHQCVYLSNFSFCFILSLL